MKQKCYIAGKIGGLPEEEYTAKFNKAKEEVAAIGFEPVSPLDLPHKHDKSWESYMKEDLIVMLQCQAIYLLDNWTTSPGATYEANIAKLVKIKILYQYNPKMEIAR
jgi:hypothetical protein